MTLRHLSDIELVQAWYAQVAIEVIADRLNVTQRWLQEQWRRLQDEERLPCVSRSMNFDEMDGRPSTAVGGDKVDLLLQRLYAVHEKPRYDIPAKLQK